MSTMPYLYRRTSGTFYLRFIVPTPILTENPSSTRDIRLSLLTTNRHEANSLAGLLRFHFHCLLDSFSEHRFTVSHNSFSRYISLQLKEYITRHHKDALQMPEDQPDLSKYLTETLRPTPEEDDSDHETPSITTAIVKGPASLPPRNEVVIESDGITTRFNHPGNPKLEREQAFLYQQQLRVQGTGGSGGGNGGHSSTPVYSVEYVFEHYIKNKLSTNLKANDDTKKEHIKMLDVLKNLLGPENNYYTFTDEDGERLCQNILNLKDARIKDQQTAKTISPTRAKKYLDKFKAISHYAKKKEFHKNDIGIDLEILFTTTSKKKGEKVFSPEHIEALLSGYPYTQTPLDKERDLWDFHYWLILVFLYTGARLNEICQLRLDDIKQTTPRKRRNSKITPIPIDYFDIKKAFDANGEQTHFIKNDKSIREVPVHQQLIDLGFLDFVEQRREEETAPSAMLFKGLYFSQKNKWGKKASDWFNGGGKMKSYRDECEFEPNTQKNIHTFRHTFINEYRNTEGIDRSLLFTIVGHDSTLQTDEYGETVALDIIKSMMDLVDYDVDLSHLDYEKFKVYRDKKGKA